ncbi:MAG: histidine kinase [Deltaproteobacteria bacterium]|nr:histidine kinase [Deltaproteobacteria bacterium]
MTIWKKITLRFRIYSVLASIVAITLVGGLIMVWYTYRMEGLLTNLIDENLAAYQRAEALETTLANQKGYVSYFFQDGNPDWLNELNRHRAFFRSSFDEARSLAQSKTQREIMNRIEDEYLQYITLKDQVIKHYMAGERDLGMKLHKDVRGHFFKVMEYCEEYKAFHSQQIQMIKVSSYRQAEKLRVFAGTALLLVLILGLLLAFVLGNDILEPLKRLAMEASPGSRPDGSDEVKALSRSIRVLIEDIDQTQSELEKSREHLLQAEKMVLVGKLAAGMAHSIRNPLTSVKMRLFSLNRTLDLSSHQREDFQVISEEISHVDNIVQSFLEFSRPPKLRVHDMSPSDVVDHVLRLLSHRLQSYNVKVRLERNDGPLPEIKLDPERLKEVLVNIIENACEAMKGGGSMMIREEQGFDSSLGAVALVHVSDSGHGIPEAIRCKVFDPFFTTKEEGSGLGLSIAVRIMEEHGGRLDLKSGEASGSTFSVILPLENEK